MVILRGAFFGLVVGALFVAAQLGSWRPEDRAAYAAAFLLIPTAIGSAIGAIRFARRKR